MNKATRQILELFVQKANELKDLKFNEHVNTVGLGFRGTRTENDEWVIDFGLPDKKERDAFYLRSAYLFKRTNLIRSKILIN